MKAILFFAYFFLIPNRLPFNWKTPFGYMIATIFFLAATCAVLYALTLTLSFYAGACYFFISFSKDISNDVPLLIVGGKSKRSHQKMKARFCKIIQLNSTVKQLSRCWTHHIFIFQCAFISIFPFSRIIDEFNGIYEFMTFNYFLWTTLCECALLLGFVSQLVKYMIDSY